MSNPVRLLVGLVIVLPAAIALLIGYLVPTVRTMIWSLQQRSPFGDGSTEWVGFDNYERVFEDDFIGPLLYAVLFAGLPLVTLLVVGPLLAAAAHYAGRGGRLAVRLGLTIPMVCFAPVALAVAWQFERFDFEGGEPRSGLWLAAWLTTFGLVCAIGVKVFLAVLRGGGPGRSAWPAGLAVGGLAVITLVALALQTFTYPYLITRGGPEEDTMTAMLGVFEVGFIFIETGAGAAGATVLLILLMALGIAAGLVVVLSGLRFEYEPGPTPTGRPWAVVLTVAGLLVVLAVTLYGLWPWLTGLGQLSVEGAESRTGSALVNTWLPPLVSTVVGIGLAAVAGFGIGALRPFGRFSGLLLLPFAPWLFVGVGPLMLVKYDSAANGTFERINTFAGLIPPIWLAVPALFLFTLLFRGLAKAGVGYGPMLLRSLPMLALVGAATWLVQSQSLLWGLVASVREPNMHTLLVRLMGELAADPDALPLGLVLPIPVIVIFALGLGALNAFYLDRLSIRAGRER